MFESVTPESLQVAAEGLCPELGMGHNQTGLLSLHLWGALAALSWGHGKGKFVSDTRRLFNCVFWTTGIFRLQHLYQNQCKGPDWCWRAHATRLVTCGDALQNWAWLCSSAGAGKYSQDLLALPLSFMCISEKLSALAQAGKITLLSHINVYPFPEDGNDK